MPSVDRDESRDRELVLKHQPSFSDSVSGRSSVSIPMYVDLSKHMAYTAIAIAIPSLPSALRLHS